MSKKHKHKSISYRNRINEIASQEVNYVRVIIVLFVCIGIIISTYKLYLYLSDTKASRLEAYKAKQQYCAKREADLYIVIAPIVHTVGPNVLGFSEAPTKEDAVGPSSPNYARAVQDALTPHHYVDMICDGQFSDLGM